MKKIVLLTGGTGFTGQYVKAALERLQLQVVCMTTHEPKSTNEVYGNLLDQESLIKLVETVQPDYVIHLAAIAFVGHANESDFYNTNVVGTLNLLNAITLAKPNVEKVILASSANVYGNPKVNPVSELISPAPINHYAMSKLSMETLAQNIYGDRLPLLIVRPFNYTGRGQSNNFLVPKIVEHFYKKAEKISLGNLNVTREFNDVRDIAQCYAGLLLSEAQGEIVNLCSGYGYTLNNLLESCAELTGHQLVVEVDAKLVRPNELRVLTGDPNHLLSLVPSLQFTPLKETLSWMLQE
ncbi:NAD-dependent epimerase/dehydratase family protein [Acinetobacter sp.]|uniref:NAD-dependent epimerase/dehydratase family protein n=1 Tax=Acinetobacter sp. TaxID=472 RepID=UPI0031D76983